MPTLAPNGQPLDVDNLSEPVFAVLTGRLKYFGGSRKHIATWSASKRVGARHGCAVKIADAPLEIPRDEPNNVALYRGPLPEHARSREVATWASDHLQRVAGDGHDVTLRLVFGSPTLNIGQISTGVIKAFIDCLFPVLGGLAGRPHDHRSAELHVARGVESVPEDAVQVELAVIQSASIRPYDRIAPGAPSKVVREPRRRPRANPCRPGTRKHAVLEAALTNESTDEAQQILEAIAPGAGRRLREYLSDIRSADGFDVGIECERLYFRDGS